MTSRDGLRVTINAIRTRGRNSHSRKQVFSSLPADPPFLQTSRARRPSNIDSANIHVQPIIDGVSARAGMPS